MANQSYQPTIAHLRAFVAVAHHRHFGAAAHSLGVSQPSLSQSLATLEEGIHRTLIERSTRRVIVTQEGESLLPYAEAVIAAADHFRSAAQGLGHGLEGDLSIGLIPTAAPYILPQVLSLTAQHYPNLSVTVIEDQTARLLESLRAGRIDVALLALPLGETGFNSIPIYQEDFVLAVPKGHPLEGRNDLPTSVLREVPLLLLDEGHCLRDQTIDLCHAVGATVGKSNTRAASLPTILQCVSAGMGVTLIPVSAIPVEGYMKGIAIARFADPVPGRKMGLVYRSSSTRGGDWDSLARTIGDAFANTVGTTHEKIARRR